MTSTKCWDCGAKAHMTPLDGAGSIVRKGLLYQVQGCTSADSEKVWEEKVRLWKSRTL